MMSLYEAYFFLLNFNLQNLFFELSFVVDFFVFEPSPGRGNIHHELLRGVRLAQNIFFLFFFLLSRTGPT